MAVVNTRQITSRTFGDQNPIFDLGNPFSAPLEKITNVKLIDPHRVVAESGILQTANELPGGAQNLAQFLQTLYGRDRGAFEAIEAFVREVFPEFRYVNPVSRANNQLSLELTEAGTGKRIPLSNCGTGVEQILTLTTFVLTTPKPGLVLMDEPHSYLHPAAERALVQFLHRHSEHKYVISTHSAVLMNSVEPDRIISVSPPGQPYKGNSDRPEVSKVLFDLGYRNSDALFHDRLVLVEGKSDKAILPVLLLADGVVSQSELNHTGFPVLDGVGKGSIALQTAMLRFEALLGATGQAEQPRIYLFDADRKDDENVVLKGTRSPVTGEQVKAAFLARLEIENYLLVSDAISAAIGEELTLKGQLRNVTKDEIDPLLSGLLVSKDNNLFPQGNADNSEPEKYVKGSLVLKKLYEGFGLQYDKLRSGTLIAKHISAKNQPALIELSDLVRPIFAKAAKRK
jgi:hypothetical protein